MCYNWSVLVVNMLQAPQLELDWDNEDLMRPVHTPVEQLTFSMSNADLKNLQLNIMFLIYVDL